MEDSAVANEKSIDFEDGIGDPELEARLYAEIYFSNESYENIERPDQTVNQTLHSGDQLSSESRAGQVNHIDITSKSLNAKNPRESSHYFYDYGNQNDPTASNASVRQIVVPRLFPKQQRLLARKDLWLPSKNVATSTSGTPDLTGGSTWTAKDQTIDQMCRAVSRTLTVTPSGKNNSASETPGSSKKKRERKRSKKKHRLPETPRLSKKNKQNLPDNLSPAMPCTSKYSTVSKRTKLNMKEAKVDTLSISSDSDDSILEVPIPPKVQPPLIELPDSDDDCDTNGSTGTKNKSSSVPRPNKAKRKAEKSRNAAKVTCEYDELSSVLADTDGIDDSTEKSMDVEAAASENDKTIGDEGTDLILNLSQRPPHVEGHGNDAIDEDFRPEGVAEEGMSMVAETRRSHDPANPENRSCPAGHRDASDNSAIVPSTGRNIDIAQENANMLGTDDTERPNESAKRKRQKYSESRSSGKNSTSETPEKRRKRDGNATSANESMTDYFFKPMTDEMQAFYNGPCGSESMNVDDIQSRMPNLAPPSRKRGRVCPRCRNDFHHGKRCPEQPSVPSCSMCGAKGHTETRCPQTMCLTCGHKYTSFRQTCNRCAKLSCDICHGVGHGRVNCPDLWRRFHDTTTETLPQPKSLINTMKEPQQLSCCNCARRGHAAATCQQLRWSQHYPTPMYVSSYTEGPYYPGFQREWDGNENQLENMEQAPVPVTLPVPEECIFIETTNKGRERDLIFECGSSGSGKISAFTLVSKRLDAMPSAHLDGLIARRVSPQFLSPWRKTFAFNVKIKRTPADGIRLLVRANCQAVAHGIEKLMMQWITRSDLEKLHMKHQKLPCNNFGRVVAELERQIRMVDETRDPEAILSKVGNLETALQRTCMGGPAALKKSKKRRKSPVQRILDKMIRERAHLTKTLYLRSWVAGGELLVRRFRHLCTYFFNRNDFGSPEYYLDTVYVYNELYTYYESDALTQALAAAISISCTNTLSSKYSIPAIASRLPLVALKSCPYVFNRTNNSEAPLKSPLTGNDNVQSCSTLVNDVTTQETTNDCQENFHDFNLPQMSSSSSLPNSLRSSNSGNTLLLNPCRKSQQPARNKKGENKMIANLPKKRRRQYYALANEVMCSAKMLNISELRTMADALKQKVQERTVLCSEILALQRAILRRSNILQVRENARRRKQSQANGR